MFRPLLFLVAVALLAGCASPGEVPTPGSGASPQLTPTTQEAMPTPSPSPTVEATPTTSPVPLEPTPSTPTPTSTPTPAPTPATPAAGEWPPRVRLEPLFANMHNPLLVTHAGDGSGRIFIVEQVGRVKLARDGSVADKPFLDIRTRTEAEAERGLLGVAFSPNHAQDGLVYVSYTDLQGDSILARYRLEEGTRDKLDPASEEVILKVDQPYANHNGGHIAFGHDGMLYYALGDGGGGGDPNGNGQNPNALLASLLRLDVSTPTGYASPEDNPYFHGDGRKEVWAKGLRNPWRFSFDRATGDLYIADVGQNKLEEINFQPAGSEGGQNYGWNVFEGTDRYKPLGTLFKDATAPVAMYTHEEGGCAITGGFVYRGERFPSLAGTYFFGDYCSGKLWALRYVDDEWRTHLLLDTPYMIASFGEDEAGELYVADHKGEVLRLVADTA